MAKLTVVLPPSYTSTNTQGRWCQGSTWIDDDPGGMQVGMVNSNLFTIGHTLRRPTVISRLDASRHVV
ncbi:hypothetical protein XF_1826 [Xylella fastidiosa 9a5c]|uniref:Uncharacterized protein n=1 Tax=Xylella fastidiosa (strain 9a5c) TaxID=160492 RepID=Q9PCF5_XYLFA|nr:hypothetical protein XF_1826 [Xylella fastidiosa 9a5c]OJZ70495.1 hypothetical protein B375_0205340 [Xylella fastidiosa 6c]